MGDANLGRAILEISTKDLDAKAGLNKFKSDAQATLKEIQAAFDKLGKSLSTSTTTSLGQLNSNLTKLESSGKSAASGLKVLESGVTATEKAAGNLHKTATNVGAGLQNLSKGAADAGGGIIKLGSGAAGIAVSGLEKVGSVALSAGVALTKLGLVGGAAMVGLAVVGVKSAGDLQEAVNNISTIKPDIDTSAVFKSLNEISTRVPQSAKQLGDSLYNIFSSISINQKDAVALVEKFAQGAVGAQTDADTWGTAMLGVMNAYGKGLGDVDKIQDTFFNTINAGVVNGKQLASALGPVTASAKTAGLSIEELGAAIVGVTKEGGDASQNINNLNNYLQKVTTKEAQAAMNGLGVKTVDTTGKFRPFSDVLTDLKGKLSTMTEAQKANALQAIFPDAQARQGAIVLMSQLDAVKASLKDNEKATGSATAAYQKMASGMKAQATLLKNSVVADLTAMGAGMLPAITPGITSLAQAFNSQRGNFEKLGKALGTDLTNGIILARDGILTFKAALAGNWADADSIRPLHAIIGNIGLILHNDVIPAWENFDKALKSNGETVGKLVSAFSPLSIALSVIRGYMVGGLDGAFQAFELRVKGAGDALGGLAHALGLSDEFNAIRSVIDPTVKSVLSLVGSVGQVIDKSGAIKIAGDIASKAFNLIGEAVQFVDRLIKENIGPLSQMVKNFGNGIKTALDVGTAAFKALEEPVSAVVKFLSPLLPLIGDVAAALVVYKVAAEGAGLATKLFNSGTGSMLLNLGKFALVLAPAIGAFEVAKAVVPGFTNTLDQLGFMATHVQETFKELNKELRQEVPNPYLKMGSAVTDATGKVIGYANAFETLQQAQERINKSTTAGLNIFTDASKSYGYAELNLAKLNSTMSFGYTLSYKYRDALTGQLDVMTKNNSIMQYLFTSHEKYLTSTLKAPPAVQAQMAKTAELTRQMDALDRAISGVSTANDELNKKLSEANQGISIMDGAVHQLALQHSDAKIAFHDSSAAIQDQTLSVDEAFSKWKDLTEVQKAGGKGAYEAGVAAGKLKDGLVDATKGGITPMLDATYKFIGTTQDVTKEIGANTIANQKSKEEQEKVAAKIKDSTDATAELTRITGTHGTVVTDATGKIAGGFWGSQKAIDGANKVMGIWNTTPMNPKTTDTTTIAAVKVLMEGAVAALKAWNGLKLDNKSASVTYTPVGASLGIGPSAPAPAPGNKVNSTGLSGTLGLDGFGGAGARLSGTFAQATVQATQAAFSLTGLQSQIDQIVKMFNSMDAKALKAAADQADSVSKIAGAASSMVDAFGKMKDYTSVSKEIMAKVSQDSATFTGLYIAGAKQFDVKALEGAATYIDTSGKVASAASSMVDALEKTRGRQGASLASIEGIAYDAKVMTANYYNASLEFNEGMLKGMDLYTETVGKVGAANSSAADGLAKSLNWVGVATESIEGIVFNERVMVANYYNASLYFSDKMLAGSNGFADAAGKAADATGKGADSLSKLVDFQGPALASMEGVAYDLKVVTANFYNASREFDEKMLKGASDFAETSSKVASAIGAGVTGLAGLRDYKGVATGSIETFTRDLDGAVLAFQTYAIKYQTDGLKAAGLYAETAGKIVGVIKPGVEGFNELATYKTVAAGKLALFEADIDQLIKDFTTIAGTYKPAAMEAGKAWGDSVGGIMNGLKSSVELFTSLQQYKSVPSTTLKLFIADVELTVQLAGAMAERAKGPLLDQLKKFTDATGGLFSELSSAMGLFKSLETYKSAPSTTIQAFVDEIDRTIKIADTLAQNTSSDMLARVDAFSKAVGDIFTRFQTVSTVFSNIEKFKDDPSKMVTTLMVGVKTAIDLMPGAQAQAIEFYNKIDAWAGELELAARRAAEGAAAAAEAARTANSNPGGAGTGDWRPDAGGGRNTNYATTSSTGSSLARKSPGGSGLSSASATSSSPTISGGAMDAATKQLDFISKILGTIKAGTDGLEAINAYPGIARSSLTLFENDLYLVENELIAIAKRVDAKSIQVGAVWGEATGKMLSGVKTGVDLFVSLKDYVSPARKAFTDFETDTFQIVTDLSAMATKFKPEAITAAAEWSAGVGALFSGLSGGLSLFDGINKFQGVNRDKSQLLFDQVDMLATMAGKVAALSDPVGLSKAKDYAQQIDGIFSGFNKTFEFFRNLDNLHSSPVDLIAGFLAAVNEVGTFQISSWQPSVSAATQALSSTSSTPLLNSGLSMPAPVISNTSSQTSGDVIVQNVFPNATVPFNRAQLAQIGEIFDQKMHQQGNKIR